MVAINEVIISENAIVDSIFENFFLDVYLLSFNISSITLDSCVFRNNSCISDDLYGLISFFNEKIVINRVCFCSNIANYGFLHLYPSGNHIPYSIDLNETLIFKMDSIYSGILFGSTERFACEKNNFSMCSGSTRRSNIGVDVCFDMTIRFTQFEKSYSSIPIIEVYHDDPNDPNNYFLTLKDTNIIGNRNQEAFFIVAYNGQLKLRLEDSHFMNNSQCYFYQKMGSASLIVEIGDTTFDIEASEADPNSFNLGTKGITFGSDEKYHFSRNIGLNVCRKQYHVSAQFNKKANILLSLLLYSLSNSTCNMITTELPIEVRKIGSEVSDQIKSYMSHPRSGCA